MTFEEFETQVREKIDDHLKGGLDISSTFFHPNKGATPLIEILADVLDETDGGLTRGFVHGWDLVDCNSKCDERAHELGKQYRNKFFPDPSNLDGFVRP